MMLHCQKQTVVLMLGTISIYISSTLSQVTETCLAPPREPVINYNFTVINGSSYNVCPTDVFGSQSVWVFRPADDAQPADTGGTYTVSGTDLHRCVYNISSSQHLELVVTPPQNESGNFFVMFVSLAGNMVTLAVSYAPPSPSPVPPSPSPVPPSPSPLPNPSSGALDIRTFIVTISAVGLEAMDPGRGIDIGETTSFVCEVTTTVRPLELNITWFRAENGSDVQLFQNGDNINITMETLNTTTRSTLTIRVTGMEDYTQYYCLANNGNSIEGSNFTVPLDRPAPIIPVVTLSVVAIVAIALSGPILILLVSVVVVPAGCCYYHRKMKKSVHQVIAPFQSRNLYLEESFPDGALEMKSAQSETVSVLRSLLPQQMLIANEQIQVLRVVGQGEFGVVYKAILRRAGGAAELVAVKTLKGIFTRASDVQNLVEEILIMQNFHHPNVMSLVGVSLEGNVGGPCVIMPFMAKGSLLNYLRQEAETLKPSKETDITQVGAVQKLLLKMCLQIARGMEYLASMKFVHRDLAARNCMIDMSNNVKVADFGLTEDIYTKSYFRQDTSDTSVRLPLKWMALESIKLRVFSEKTDVWSFGVTCWEVFSAGEIPYPSLHPRQVLNMLEEGERMERPRNAACSEHIYTLMLECWDANPQTRPSFADMVVRLDSLLESVAEYLDISIVVTNDKDSDTDAEKSEPINSDLLLHNEY